MLGLTTVRIFSPVCSRLGAEWIECHQWPIKLVGIFMFYHVNRFTRYGLSSGKRFSMIEQLTKNPIGFYLMLGLMIRRRPLELMFGIVWERLGQYERIPINSTYRWLEIPARKLYLGLLVNSDNIRSRIRCNSKLFCFQHHIIFVVPFWYFNTISSLDYS